jgi:hypothetical protein
MKAHSREDIDNLHFVAYLITHNEPIDWATAERLVSLGWIAADRRPSGYELTPEGERRTQP